MAIYENQHYDRVFHALADGTRRDIISMLSKQQRLSASELGKPFNMAQPSISKHLKVLEQAQLIERTVLGRSHHFSLNRDSLDVAETWLQKHRQFWQGSLDRLAALVDDLPEEKAK